MRSLHFIATQHLALGGRLCGWSWSQSKAAANGAQHLRPASERGDPISMLIQNPIGGFIFPIRSLTRALSAFRPAARNSPPPASGAGR